MKETMQETKNVVKQKAKIAKKSILSIVFSRRMLIVFLLLIQILFLFSSLTLLQEYAATAYLASAIMSMLVVVYIINSRGTPEFKMSWILFVLLIPIVGTFFYIFVKIQPGTQHIGRRLVILSNETKAYMKQDKDIVDSLGFQSRRMQIWHITWHIQLDFLFMEIQA